MATPSVASHYASGVLLIQVHRTTQVITFQYEQRLPLGGNAVTIVTDEGQRGTLATPSVASHYASNVGRCIPLRNEYIAYIGLSHDRSLFLYPPLIRQLRCHLPPKGKALYGGCNLTILSTTGKALYGSNSRHERTRAVSAALMGIKQGAAPLRTKNKKRNVSFRFLSSPTYAD